MNETERDSSTLVKDDCENKNFNSDYPQLPYPEYSPQLRLQMSRHVHPFNEVCSHLRIPYSHNTPREKHFHRMNSEEWRSHCSVMGRKELSASATSAIFHHEKRHQSMSLAPGSSQQRSDELDRLCFILKVSLGNPSSLLTSFLWLKNEGSGKSLC